MCFMGQYHQSECLPAVFPLLFHEKMTFEKGISPRLEFSTKTTIIECSADSEINIHPNVLMSPAIKRNLMRSSRPRTSSLQRNQSQISAKRRGRRTERERRGTAGSLSRIYRSQSPQRNTQHLARLSLDPAAPNPTEVKAANTSQPMLASWPGASRRDSPHVSAVLTNSSSPLVRSSSAGTLSPTGRRKFNGLVEETFEDDSGSETPDPSALWQTDIGAGHNRSVS
ncbi:spermatogenesis associated 6-like protein [Platichthys flesus]|uniref:spermatogenesis associated 6-like protein n=1 Tax=Platichthys flesus TaxID=8260 RepID=UPI002DB575AA|nr:spermatogenesis associated 6-like protein [Platichthys flesus]